MKLPAPFVKTWADIQLNFDALVKVEPTRLIGATGQPAFANGWLNSAAGASAGFYLDRERVYLRGLIRAGVIGAAAFTLPVGYRPPASSYFSTDSNGLHARVIIDTAGNVTPDIGSNASVTLEGIDFRRA